MKNMSHRSKGRDHSINGSIDDEVCCCSDPSLMDKDGYSVCINCGAVSGRQFVSNASRVFCQDDVVNKKHSETTWRSFGNRTVIDQNKGDGHGRPLKGRARSKHRHLSKINRSIIKSIDRNFLEAKPILTKVANRLNVPPYIRENSWKIYKEVARQRLTMGRSIRSFVGASIYVSCRIFGYPRIIENIAETIMIPSKDIHSALGLIVRNVLPKLGYKFKPASAFNLLFKFGNEIQLPTNLQMKAKKLLYTALKSGLRTVGKDPKGLAAAALYMIAKSNDQALTQADLSEIAKVTPVTIRSRMKEIKSVLRRRKIQISKAKKQKAKSSS